MHSKATVLLSRWGKIAWTVSTKLPASPCAPAQVSLPLSSIPPWSHLLRIGTSLNNRVNLRNVSELVVFVVEFNLSINVYNKTVLSFRFLPFELVVVLMAAAVVVVVVEVEVDWEDVTILLRTLDLNTGFGKLTFSGAKKGTWIGNGYFSKLGSEGNNCAAAGGGGGGNVGNDFSVFVTGLGTSTGGREGDDDTICFVVVDVDVLETVRISNMDAAAAAEIVGALSSLSY